MSAPYADRLRAARAALGSGAVLCVSPGADLRYLVGYDALALERPTLLIVPSGADPVLLVPELEVPRAGSQGVADRVEIRAWGETEDAFALAASVIGSSESVLVSDQMWASFVLRLQGVVPNARFATASAVTGPLRIRKDKAEVDALRTAGLIADGVARALASERVAGRTEHDVSVWISEMLVAGGCERVSFAIVAAGSNAASPHHEPTQRVIAPGDALVCDFGGTVEGYGSDITRTFVVGEPSSELARVHDIVRRAQQAGVDAVRPGVAASSVDAASRSVIVDAGYGEMFVHRTGHGIGLDAHEDPYIVSGNEAVLEPSMAFSVEPGIYLPGKLGVRIEDIVVVTPTGAERLNVAPHDLVSLPV